MDLAAPVVHPDPNVLQVLGQPAVASLQDVLPDGIGVYLRTVQKDVDGEGPVPLAGHAEGEGPVRKHPQGQRPFPRVGGAVGEAEPVVAASQDELIGIAVSILQVVDLEENRGELLVEDRRVEGELPGAVHE